MSLIAPNIIERNKVASAIIGSLLVLIIIALIFWAFSGDRARIESNLDVNIGVSEGRNGVITNLVTNQEGKVINAENNANIAVNALDESVNRPSDQFNSSGASGRFCRNFPHDPKCVR